MPRGTHRLATGRRTSRHHHPPASPQTERGGLEPQPPLQEVRPPSKRRRHHAVSRSTKEGGGHDPQARECPTRFRDGADADRRFTFRTPLLLQGLLVALPGGAALRAVPVIPSALPSQALRRDPSVSPPWHIRAIEVGSAVLMRHHLVRVLPHDPSARRDRAISHPPAPPRFLLPLPTSRAARRAQKHNRPAFMGPTGKARAFRAFLPRAHTPPAARTRRAG